MPTLTSRVFDTSQAMQACCGCPVTADGLLTLSISGSLALNPAASGQILNDGSIRIIPTLPNAKPPQPPQTTYTYIGCDTATSVCCDPTAVSTDYQLIPGSKLVAWAQHVQTTQTTETAFEAAPADPSDYGGLPTACDGIVKAGSGAGVCTCPSGT
jgi:hypothetical protein